MRNSRSPCSSAIDFDHPQRSEEERQTSDQQYTYTRRPLRLPLGTEREPLEQGKDVVDFAGWTARLLPHLRKMLQKQKRFILSYDLDDFSPLDGILKLRKLQ